MKEEININPETIKTLAGLKKAIDTLTGQRDLILRTYIDATGCLKGKEDQKYVVSISSCGTKLILSKEKDETKQEK